MALWMLFLCLGAGNRVSTIHVIEDPSLIDPDKGTYHSGSTVSDAYSEDFVVPGRHEKKNEISGFVIILEIAVTGHFDENEHVWRAPGARTLPLLKKNSLHARRMSITF